MCIETSLSVAASVMLLSVIAGMVLARINPELAFWIINLISRDKKNTIVVFSIIVIVYAITRTIRMAIC